MKSSLKWNLFSENKVGSSEERGGGGRNEEGGGSDAEVLAFVHNKGGESLPGGQLLHARLFTTSHRRFIERKPRNLMHVVVGRVTATTSATSPPPPSLLPSSSPLFTMSDSGRLVFPTALALPPSNCIASRNEPSAGGPTRCCCALACCLADAVYDRLEEAAADIGFEHASAAAAGVLAQRGSWLYSTAPCM